MVFWAQELCPAVPYWDPLQLADQTFWSEPNEATIGAAIANSGLPREDFFITTKLWASDHGTDNTNLAIDQSLEALQNCSLMEPQWSHSEVIFWQKVNPSSV